MTDTTHYADVLLPATTFLEGYDIARAYGPIGLRLARPVIEAVGEARSNAEVFGELARLLDVHQEGDPTGELEEMHFRSGQVIVRQGDQPGLLDEIGHLGSAWFALEDV